AAPDRGDLRGGQAGDGVGPLRGPRLGGLAPPRDAVAAGAVVPLLRAAAARGGKPQRGPPPRCGGSSPGCCATHPRVRRASPRASGGERGGGQGGAGGEGGGADLKVVQGRRQVPAATPAAGYQLIR